MVKTTGLSIEYIENMDYKDYLFARQLTNETLKKEAKEIKKANLKK